MIQIDMEMPKGCVVEISATTRKLCPLMESCHEKGQTIQRNSRPSDCPLKEVSDKSVLEDIKAEILEKCHGLATNIDEPYDEHEIIFADEVFEIIDSYISRRE